MKYALLGMPIFQECCKKCAKLKHFANNERVAFPPEEESRFVFRKETNQDSLTLFPRQTMMFTLPDLF